jgi:hypothetical protein
MNIKNYIIIIIILISIIIIYESINIGNNNLLNEAFLNIKKPDFTLYDVMHKVDEDRQNNTNVTTYEDKYYNLKINIVKSYLEDPILRGANIYKSEQYTRLDDIGEIKLDDNALLPKASNFIGNPSTKIVYHSFD